MHKSSFLRKDAKWIETESTLLEPMLQNKGSVSVKETV